MEPEPDSHPTTTSRADATTTITGGHLSSRCHDDYPSRISKESEMLARPERFFEDRFGLTGVAMERLLGGALRGRVDHADVYLEYRVSEELVLEEGAVKKASRHVSQGAGVRAQ